MSNHYETLKLTPDATEQQIRDAIQNERACLSTEFGAASAAAKRAVEDAASVLLDATKKQDYDAQLKASQQLPAVAQLPVPAGPAGDKAVDDITNKFNEYLKGLGFKKSDGSVDLDEAEKSGYKNLELHTDKNGQKCMVLQFPTREAAEDFMNKMGIKGGKILTESEFKSSGFSSVSKAEPADTGPSVMRM